MLITPNRNNLNRIVVLNPKGGSGKTTLATNIASYYAKLGPMPTVMDCDPQGSTMRWLDKRDASRPPVHGIAAFKKTMQATRSWQLRVPNETVNLIVDSPASLDHDKLRDLTRDATSILVPVLPSSIDGRFVRDGRFNSDQVRRIDSARAQRLNGNVRAMAGEKDIRLRVAEAISGPTHQDFVITGCFRSKRSA